MSLNKSIASLGWGGSGLNDFLKELAPKFAFGIFVAAPAAKAAADVHATIAANTSIAPVTTGLTSPVYPRNARVTFLAAWDGGDVVLTGTDQFGVAQTETFTSNPGAVVVGVKVWKTIDSIMHTVVGATANTYSVGSGDKLGLGMIPSAGFFIGTHDGLTELMTLDAANGGFTPATLPNGAVNYSVLVNKA